MSDKNAEKIQPEAGTPAPATSTATATAEKPVTASAPVSSPTEKQDAKVTAAFIAMRKENRELRQKAALATATPAPAPAPATTPETAQVVTPSATPAPVPVKTVRDIEGESVKAIEAIAAEKDVASVPGAILDIINMVDTDPRLSSLHDIDPTLAFREAKGLWANKVGVGATPTVPASTPVSGGIGGGGKDLDALVAECEKAKPGSKEFNTLAKQIREKLGVHTYKPF